MTTVQRFSLLALVSSVANAQTLTLTAPSNDGRPVNTIIEQIEKLSGIPISYEDLIYSNPADTMDIASSVVRGPIAPGVHVIVPRGGALAAAVTVNPATQTVSDALGTTNALNSILAAANSSPAIAGRFKSDSYNNVLFVVPTHFRSIDSAFTPLTAVLSTSVDLPGVQQTAIETLEAIVQQVSQKAGVKVQLGTIPVMAFAVSKVTIAASKQPASYVLANLFNAISIAGGGPTAFAGMSYHAFFDPGAKNYVLNIHIVPNANVPPAVVSPSQPTTSGSPWAGKTP